MNDAVCVDALLTIDIELGTIARSSGSGSGSGSVGGETTLIYTIALTPPLVAVIEQDPTLEGALKTDVAMPPAVCTKGGFICAMDIKGGQAAVKLTAVPSGAAAPVDVLTAAIAFAVESVSTLVGDTVKEIEAIVIGFRYRVRRLADPLSAYAVTLRGVVSVLRVDEFTCINTVAYPLASVVAVLPYGKVT